MKENYQLRNLALEWAIMSVMLFFSQTVLAQKDPVYFDYFPPSPQVASLGKHGETNVSTYTGIPSIAVPIWEYQGRKIAIPLSLSYHASGIKVEELASNVGLGWNLNGAGAVSRTMSGLPDDMMNIGFWSAGVVPPSANTNTYHTTLTDYYRGSLDSQPDMFNFSLPTGKSGRFSIDKAGNVHCIPKQRIKIEKIVGSLSQSGAAGNVVGWRIKTEDGTVYLFKQVEYSKSKFFGTNAAYQALRNYYYASSWHITEIIAPYNVEKVSYTYEGYTTKFRNSRSDTKYYPVSGGGSGQPESYSIQETEILGQRLKQITFPLATVTFNYDAGENYRCDLIGDKALREIRVNLGSITKSFKLHHSYYNGSGSYETCPNTNGAYNHDLYKRLRLDSVQQQSPTGNSLPPYKFSYDSRFPLPSRESYAQDHWGYYNGKSFNTSLVPSGFYDNGVQYISLGGANRSSDSLYVKSGILNKITYPTGGFTILEFETNTCNDAQLPPLVVDEQLHFNGMEDSRSKTFRLVRTKRPSIELSFKQDNAPIHSDPTCRILLDIKNLAGTVTYHTVGFGIRDRNTIVIPTSLPSGEYQFAWRPDNSLRCTFTEPFLVTMKWQNEVEQPSVGGLRIKKIIHHDGISSANNQTKYYDYSEANGLSSGQVVTIPKYDYFISGESQSMNGIRRTSDYVRTSTPNISLAYTQGSPVGYRRVTCYESSSFATGKTIYEYYTAKDFPDYAPLGRQGFPFAPLASQEWKRGLLRTRTDYKYQGGSFVPVKKVSNSYSFSDAIEDSDEARSVKVGVNNFSSNGQVQFTTTYYYPVSGRYELISTKETTYGNSNDSSLVETNYTYDPIYYNLKRSTTQNSKQRPIQERIYYPYDYSAGADSGVDKLRSDTISAQPIAKEVWIEDKDQALKLATASVTTFKMEDGRPLVDKQYRLVADSLLPIGEIGAFSPTALLRKPACFDWEANFLKYDAKGNPQQVRRADNIPTTYLWGYNSTYPIAEIKNATYAEVVAVLGQSVIDELAGANPGTDAQVRQKLAPLRTDARLKKAQVSILTYRPLVGMTSATDAAGVTTYYEYDDFQRLKQVKDLNGNIVRQNIYHYKGQP